MNAEGRAELRRRAVAAQHADHIMLASVGQPDHEQARYDAVEASKEWTTAARSGVPELLDSIDRVLALAEGFDHDGDYDVASSIRRALDGDQ